LQTGGVEIDITAENCPMTFVRAKIELEKLPVGSLLSIRLREGEPLHNVPRAMLDHGHEIVSKENMGDGIYLIVVRKCV
jgi:TusA-related sulfurtransferase